MTRPFVSLGLKSGVWEGRLPDGPAPARGALTLNGRTVGQAEVTPGADVYTHLARDLRSATLPDGTRASRAGDHEDGTPRFVKVREGEK